MATGRIPTTANSPLTVKGDLFGYSTTQARVPVGNDGETLVADSSTSTGLRYGANFAAGKNKIINGDFSINQRGFTSTTTDGIYGLDRWVFASSGGCTYSAQTFTTGTAPVSGYEGVNFARLLTTGQSGAGVYSVLTQNIESVRTNAGSTITISFWAKSASSTPKIFTEVVQSFGTGGSPSSAVVIAGGQSTISTSWARYSVTIAVPSISGKTIGTNKDDYLQLNFWVSAGTTFNSRTSSLGIQSNTFDFWGIQVEQGSTATAFQTATGTIQGELAACQRYYYRIATTTNNIMVGAGQAYLSTEGQAVLSLPVFMRTAPSVTASGGNIFTIWSGGIAPASTAVGSYAVGNQTFELILTTSGLTQGRAITAMIDGGRVNNAYLEMSSEL